MNAETLLLWGALAAFAAALGVDLAPTPLSRARRDRWADATFHAGTGLLVAAVTVLTFYFLTANLRIEYVFTYTRTTYPWYYRMAGLWAGQKGTLLLWAALTGALGAAALAKGRRARHEGALPADADATIRVLRRGLLAVLVLLTLSTLVARTFAPTADYLLQFRPHGNGLQPVLITPFMVIHPPIQFVFYALTATLFAGGLAAVATGQPHWAPLIRPWARLTWAVATLGLGLGGLWAYYVLNFGGYWAWDPVETANLVAWFPLTLLLHSLLRYQRGDHQVLAPLFALLTLPLVIFATVATRTGLWVSVHAFTDPSMNFARDPLVRLLNILETSELLQYLTGMFAALLLLVALALVVGRTRAWPTPRRNGARAAAAALLGAAATWTLLAPVAAYSALFQSAHALTFGQSAAMGLLLLGFAGAAVVLLTGPEEPRRAKPPRTPLAHRLLAGVTHRNLLTIGITALGIALLVMFLLLILSVNGYDRAIYDDRVPLLVLLIFLSLSALFLLPVLGPRRALAASGTALALGTVGALLLRDLWQLALVAPILILALAASLVRAVRHAAAGGHAGTRDRQAALVLLGGGLVAFLYWANPPHRIQLGPLDLHPHWGWAVPALALAAFAVVAAGLHLGQPHRPLAHAAAFALVPLLGPYGVVSLAGVAALALLAVSPRPDTPSRTPWAARRPALRKGSIYLLHAAIVLGMLGFALSTYAATLHDEVHATPEDGDAAGPYTFRILDAQTIGHDAEQNLPLELQTHLRVYRHGDPLADVRLTHWLVPDDTPGHYDARVTVLRDPVRDVYIFPVVTHTPTALLLDHTHFVDALAPQVDRVEMSVKVMPGMNLVWAGLFLSVLSMGGNLAAGGFHVAAPAASPTRPAAADAAPRRAYPDPARAEKAGQGGP